MFTLVTANIVVVLPGNRLLVNDVFIEPNMECYLKRDKEEVHGMFVSAEPKEVDCVVLPLPVVSVQAGQGEEKEVLDRRLA